jgi:peptide/nickel transport system permease protein
MTTLARSPKLGLGRVARRLFWALVVVLGVGTLAFVMARRLPGDPARMLVGPQASELDVAEARRIYGLDRSLWGQYASFWTRLVHADAPPAADHASCARLFGGRAHLDLGFSYRYRKPVARLIAERAPASLALALAAICLQALLGVGLGLVSARWQQTVWDRLAIGSSVLASSAPIFVLGLSLQYVFAHRLGWLPLEASSGAELGAMVLPALTLGLYGAALYARLARDELARALGAEYVRAARARGASMARAVTAHALRNSLLPIVTLLVLDLGALVGGAVVTERLFRWPGLGAMAVDAMMNRDGPVIFGTVLVSAAAMVLATLLSDLLVLLVDPRLRRPASP